tara:strand:+ start:602 stop:949 length:348 start_codon:yes stop_codon:yes gene_type:complete
MNTQKSVYNRLFSKEEKTELETHKVELGLIDNAKVLVKILSEASDELTKELKVRKLAQQKVDESMTTINKTAQKIKEAGKKIASMEKDLGLNSKKGEEFIDYAEKVENVAKSKLK